MVKTVVVLGAGWAGLPLAHKLLKYTVPKVRDKLKVVLVSPNTHFFWNVAAVRGIIPGAFADEQLFLPIEPGFKEYGDAFQFILGKAESINLEANEVEVVNNDGHQLSLVYDQLVIATGSQIRNNLPFKPVGTHEETIKAFHALQDHIEAAKSIVIAGSGPTGVETAGELAAAYGERKTITLVMGGDCVLQASNALPSVSQTIESDLRKLGVKLVYKVKVERTESIGGASTDGYSRTSLTLSNGEMLTADLYLPLIGVQVNTKFVPGSLLDATKSLTLDKNMRVKGVPNVWGIGDVGNIEPKQLTVTDAQIIHLAAALDAVLTGQSGGVKDYKPSEKPMIFVTLGKKYGTGQIGGWKLWGFLVRHVKGRYLFVDIALDYVGGRRLRHASM